MDDKAVLLENISRIHTTRLGAERIVRNLELNEIDPVEYCKGVIADKRSGVYKKGKNFYCELDWVRITVNSHSYTIITAHKIK